MTKTICTITKTNKKYQKPYEQLLKQSKQWQKTFEQVQQPSKNYKTIWTITKTI